ncbi:MAG: hypothetical protein H0T58_03375 [Gemmatimonadales bacterium]|nr:hypothetical protein [Gemmatimonadales bacterium]
MSLPSNRVAAALALSSLIIIGGCRSAGRFLGELLRERPPAPLDSMSVASDVRIDSLGYLVGSFVGEGTSRSVHLLSSDTGLVAGLLRRYRPDLVKRGDVWGSLSREGAVNLLHAGRRRTVARAPRVEQALVGSPVGHNAVTPNAILLRGSCGWRGAQVEVVADPHRQGVPLRGPVLGSFTRREAPEGGKQQEEFRSRESTPAPGAGLIGALTVRTAAVMDSVLAAGFQSLDLRKPGEPRLEINTLSDVDAADVISFRPGPGAVRYAVSLRARRVTRGGDTLLAATVMAWDSAGVWQQTIFRPTLLSLSRGRLTPYGALRRSLFWRRLQPISDFAFGRDNLWMEQVDVRRGSVLWGIIQPRGNVVVAAAEVETPCR